MSVIKRIVWDEWNISHIMRHDVTNLEVEKALKDTNVVFYATYNGRILALGKPSDTRMLCIILNEDSPGIFYVITARDMSKKERNLYRDAKRTQKSTKI